MKNTFELVTGERVKRDVRLVMKSCRWYFNAQHRLLKLSSKERCFLDFLCEQMDSYNTVTIDKPLLFKFKTFLKKITSGKNDVGISSLSRFVKKLQNNLFIYKVGTKGSTLYTVNPRYFFKSSEKNRAMVLKELIQLLIDNDQSLDGLIDTCQVEFLRTDSKGQPARIVDIKPSFGFSQN